MDLIQVLLAILFWIFPLLVAVNICHARNRDKAKGFVVALLTGWIGVIGMWLMLKKRDPVTKQLII